MMSITELRDDLSPFRDPATDIVVTQLSDSIKIEIVKDAEARVYFYSLKDGTITRSGRGVGRKKAFASISSLLASEEFACLAQFREASRRISEQDLANLEIDCSLEINATIDYEDHIANDCNFSQFCDASTASVSNKVSFVLLDGAAGSGKTALLYRLVNFRSSTGGVPVLHVTSKGRRLSNLRDAIAGTVATYRAKFVPEEVPVLVRHGLLQIALDGFDEFVDEEGYRNAWAVLKDFIRQCKYGSPLILSGRDTFFDGQLFVKLLSDTVIDAKVKLVRLNPLRPSAAMHWLRSKGWDADDLSSNIAAEIFKAGSYILRPYYLAMLCKIGSLETIGNPKFSIHALLTESVVTREANILKGSLEVSVDLIKAELDSFFELMSEDMAERESEYIPKGYLSFLAEYCFSSLPQDAARRIRANIGSIVLVEQGEQADELRFAHTNVQARYLARSISRQLADGVVPNYISRIVVGRDRVAAFADRVTELSSKDVGEIRNTIARKSDEFVSSTRAGSNLWALYLSILNQEPENTYIGEITSMYIEEVILIGVPQSFQIKDVVFGSVDAVDADLSNLAFDESIINNFVVSDSTRVGDKIPSIQNLFLKKDGSITVVRSSSEIHDWLSAHRRADDLYERTRNLSLVRFFDRICLRFMGQKIIRMHDEDEGSFLLRGDNWNIIKGILMNNERIRYLEKNTSGVKTPFVVVDYPERLLSPSAIDTSSTKVRHEVIRAALNME